MSSNNYEYQLKQEMISNNYEYKPKHKKKKKKSFLSFLFKFLIVIVVLVICALLYFSYVYDDSYINIPIVNKDEFRSVELDADDEENLATWAEGGHTRLYYDAKHPIVKVKKKDINVENILVFGIDSRNINDYKCRTDSIIIVSIDNFKHTVKLTSIMRDSGVYIGDIPANRGSRINKINAAYAYGGVGQMINTINMTFDLDIQKFVMVDFSSAKDIVDICDGVEIEVKEKELEYINHFIRENNKMNGTNSPEITKAGKQTLDGIQAVSWSRIRYADSDFVRTSRQRTIVTGLMKKVGKMNIVQKSRLIANSSGVIKTNIKSGEMLLIAISAASGVDNVDEYRVPEEGLYKVQNNPWMMIVDYDKQKTLLHKFIWGTK